MRRPGIESQQKTAEYPTGFPIVIERVHIAAPISQQQAIVPKGQLVRRRRSGA